MQFPVDFDSPFFLCRRELDGRPPGMGSERALSCSVAGSEAPEKEVILDDRRASDIPDAENALPDLRVPLSASLERSDLRRASCRLEKLSAAVAALRMLDVLIVLLLASDKGRSLIGCLPYWTDGRFLTISSTPVGFDGGVDEGVCCMGSGVRLE